MSDCQYKYLRKRACEAGLSMSGYLRALLERDASERLQLASFVAEARGTG
jgi:hypothetical protein